jgi:hypothetical protein
VYNLFAKMCSLQIYMHGFRMRLCMNSWMFVTYVSMFYVCMYVCMYLCLFICLFVCLHVCMHVCMYVCMYVFVEMVTFSA